MRTLFSCCFIVLLTLVLVINEASAKRFGGGRSFGVQRSQSSLFKQHSTQNTPLGQTAKSKWGGMLGGLLVGGLLASLFMGNGLANGLMTWLVLGLVLFFIVGFLRRRMLAGVPSAQTHPLQQNSFNYFTKTNTSNSSNGNFSDYPAEFDPEPFLRNAKVNFIRLQAAYDQKNIQDLNAFTAPEVFAEIKMQLEERGDEPNKTEVGQLDAQLLDVSRQSYSTIASVRFTGSIKENDDPITPLDEIWHFSQFDNTKEWVITGIQQEVVQPV